MEDRIKTFLANEEYSEIASIIDDLELNRAVELLSEFEDEDLIRVCRLMDSDKLADCLTEIDPEKQEYVINSLHEDKLQDVMDSVSEDDTIDLIESLPATVASRIVDTDEIRSLLSDRKFAVLKEVLANTNEVDIAEILDELEIDECIVIFRLLPKDMAADTFVELSPDIQSQLLAKFSDKELKGVMDELFVDDVVDIIEEMPANVVRRLLARADAETRAYVNEILKYPHDSAGSIMTVEFVVLFPEMTIAEAFSRIRETAIDKETIYTCYVTDKTKHLLGVVTVKDLLLAKSDAFVGDVMEENVIWVHTHDDKEDVATKLSDYDFLAIPVVDDEKRIVGIVTVDDAMDVLQEEATEDIEKINAIKPSDKPYLKTSIGEIFKNRIPWLIILMVSSTFTGLIINMYESRLNAISSVLFACVPMMMGTGGNAGSQASVTVIRSLALNELSTRDVFRVQWKELRASILLGAVLSVACFVKLLLIENLLFGYADYTPVMCAVISLALFVTVVISKLVGCTLPLLVKKCKLDPAVVASPFITTIVDAVSLIIYCALAVTLLS